MTWWLYLPLISHAIALPSEDLCERVRARLVADGHAAQCQTMRPAIITGQLPPEIEADLQRLVERGGT